MCAYLFWLIAVNADCIHERLQHLSCCQIDVPFYTLLCSALLRCVPMWCFLTTTTNQINKEKGKGKTEKWFEHMTIAIAHIHTNAPTRWRATYTQTHTPSHVLCMISNTVEIQHINHTLDVCLRQIHIHILCLWKKKIPVLNWDIACECAIEPSFGKTTMHTCATRKPVQIEFVRKCITLRIECSFYSIKLICDNKQSLTARSSQHRMFIVCRTTFLCDC